MCWKCKTEDIVEEVEEETLTPKDYTLQFYNIPSLMNIEEVKTMILEKFPNLV